MDLQEELEIYYKQVEGKDRVSTDEGETVAPFPIRTVRPHFQSHHAGYLLEIDREIDSNLSFQYVLLLPSNRGAHGRCLVIGHGFNEGAYTKLYPWAYSLCRTLQIPTVIFPLAFHINRRPVSWLHLMRPFYRDRKEVAENGCPSLFNAVISQRMAEAPERFFRGSLQSYGDMLEFIQRISDGSLEVPLDGKQIRPFRDGTHIHFLGYSISGFLHLTLLLMHGQGFLHNSRCLLFSTCASWQDIDPVSVLVIDQDAFQRAGRFYQGSHKKEGSREFLRWLYETEVGLWFRRLFLEEDREILHREVQKLDGRLVVVVDPKDPVFPIEGIVRNLGKGVPIFTLSLGRHEFPFNIESLDQPFPKIVDGIRKSYAPSLVHWPSFCAWLDLAKDFLTESNVSRSEGETPAAGKHP
jgi:hypothetical protein